VVTSRALPKRSAGELFNVIVIVSLRFGFRGRRRLCRLWHAKKFTTAGEFLLSVAISKKAIITNPDPEYRVALPEDEIRLNGKSPVVEKKPRLMSRYVAVFLPY
jgi:hypothetical protein